MSKKQQRDLFSDSPDDQSALPQKHGKASETARHRPSTRIPSKDQRQKKSAKDHFERVHLKVEEVAAWYGVSVATIWRWRRTNPHFPQGHNLTAGSRRWFRSDLEAYDKSIQEQKS